MTENAQEKYLEELEQAYNRLFRTDDGVKVLDDLKRVGFFLDTTINENPNITNWNEGQRNMVLHILTKISMPIHNRKRGITK